MVQTVDAFGTLDILVNNAGIVRDRTLLKMEETTSTRSSPCTSRAPSTAAATAR
jgi:NAD(P)-dependent dehydrogenase (short-subunit alcohol dehydrogenase family)